MMGSKRQRKAPGKFVQTPQGKVYYEASGPRNGQHLILIHGLTVPCFVWDPVFKALSREGFRVIRYDLFGRGFSDRPRATFDAALFEAQLAGLLETLNISRPVHLAGVSMGGAIASGFTLNRNTLVDKLILVNPAGLIPRPRFPQNLKLLPFSGEIYMKCFGKKHILNTLDRDFATARPTREYKNRMKTQMAVPGFGRALLSTLRSGILHDMAPVYKQLGKTGHPVMVIWGTKDRILPPDNLARLKQLLGNTACFPLQQAGHLPFHDRPNDVLHMFKLFLTSDNFNKTKLFQRPTQPSEFEEDKSPK